MQESQNIECKEIWKDEYLKWICGFANANGGKIFIGKNDKGEIIGLKNSNKLLEDIPNKIQNHLGIICDYTKAGKWYWLKYIAGIIGNGGDYGDGTGGNDGYIGVGEMWGNYFGYICEKDYFGSASIGATDDWYKPQIMRRIDDEVYGMTPHKIFTCLQSNVRNHQELKNKLISYYGHSTQINQIFSSYGF